MPMLKRHSSTVQRLLRQSAATLTVKTSLKLKHLCLSQTQAVLPLLKSDLLTVMQATTNGTLADVSVEFSTDSACCVVLASEGYPQKYESGFPITMSEEAAAHCYVAGAKKDSDTLLTAGGRVLGVTAVAPTLRAAVEDAYHLAEGVDFANKYCRGDIGSAALAAREERG